MRSSIRHKNLRILPSVSLAKVVTLGQEISTRLMILPQRTQAAMGGEPRRILMRRVALVIRALRSFVMLEKDCLISTFTSTQNMLFALDPHQLEGCERVLYIFSASRR